MRAAGLGGRQTPCPSAKVKLLPRGAEQFRPPSAEEQGQLEVGAPPPVRLGLDRPEHALQLLRAEKSVALLFAEHSDAGCGVIVAEESPLASEVEDCPHECEPSIGGVVPTLTAEFGVKLGDVISRYGGKPPEPPPGWDWS